jgi:tetratricopeptide (TPR) repeat protein
MRRDFLLGLALIAITFCVYWSVRTCEFTNYDDTVYVTENGAVQAGLTGQSTMWAFQSTTRSNWHPLTWLSHMLDCEIYGLNAGRHHLTNLILHAANTLLLFLLLKRMTGACWRSAFVAALFALHPLHVESVAWVAERKDVLSTFFGFLALWAYARSAEKAEIRSPKPEGGESASQPPAAARADHVSRITHYAPALFFFALSLMSKPMFVTLPFVLLLLDFWPLGRFPASIAPPKAPNLLRLMGEKVPFFALAAVSCGVTFWAQQKGGSVATFEALPAGQRFANALVSYVRYIGKMFWPGDLAVFYPYSTSWPAEQVIGAALGLLVVSALVVLYWRQRPYLAVGWFWYLGTLVPVIGIIQVGAQSLADRYAYVPLIGLFIILAWGANDLLGRRPHARWIMAGLALPSLATCGILTAAQLRHWKDSESLFKRALAVTQDNYVAHLNLGVAYASQEKLAEAAAQFDEVLRISPGLAPGHYNRGGIYARQGQFAEADAEFDEAYKLKPDYEQVYLSRGNVLALQQKYEEAKEQFAAALRINPSYAEAENNLGNALVLLGHLPEALPHFKKAMKINPNLFEAHYFLAGDLARRKRLEEAILQFRAALRIKKDDASALNDLAWILATGAGPAIHDPPEAVRLAARACEVTGHTNCSYLDTLAVAQSEVGRFTEAAALTERAAALAAAGGDPDLAERLRSRLDFYRAGRTYTQGVGRLPAGNPR